MCILFIYTNPQSSKNCYKVIIASNRDEYYTRPAQCAYHCLENDIIGGRDMEQGREGGMWLGISVKKNENFNFRFGGLLNVTGEERKSGVKGRGVIVTDYLKNDDQAKEYINMLENPKEVFNAYNFVAVELTNDNTVTYHHSNSPMSNSVYNGQQILGFGNSTTEHPLTKVKNGKEKFGNIIQDFNQVEHKDQLVDNLIQLLRWEQRHLPDPELQRRSPLAYEHLSSAFVKIVDAGYGTRTHSVVLIDYDNNVEFIEITMEEPIDPENPKWHTTTIKSRL